MRSAISRESAKRMRGCLGSLMATQPFFGSLALRMPLTEAPKVKTVASDGQLIRYNPLWVKDNTADQVKAAIAHVVMACALKHHVRRGERQYNRWQNASRMVTLPYLRDSGLSDEQGGLDMSAEKAYESLPKDDDDDECDQPKQSGSDGDGQGDGQGEGEGDGGSGDGDGGSGNGNPDPNGQGEIQDAPSEVSADEQEQAWDEAMHQAAAFAKAQGRLPGNLAQMIESAHGGLVDWRDILRRFMTAAANNDYTWTRPNRRFIDDGLYLPSLYSESMPPIVFAIDTSASMNEQALRDIWGEIRSAVDEVQPENVTVIQCDTRVTSIEQYDPHDLPAAIDAKGRGGTSFMPVFEAMAQIPDPACMIYMTDLYCYEKVPPQNFPLLWAVVDGPPVGDPYSDQYNQLGERIDIR